MLKKNSKIIAIITFIFIMACSFSLAACSENESQGGQTGGDSAELSTGPESETEGDNINQNEQPPEKQQESVTYDLALSYANMKYIETGDESLPKLIRGVDGKVELEGEKNETLDSHAVKMAIDELRKAPEGVADAETLVTDNFKIRDVFIDGSYCNIDLAGDVLEETDMYQEQFFVYQVTDTVLSSFDNIESVMFTVDGEVDGVFNYIDISAPYTDDDVQEFNGVSDDAASAQGSGRTGEDEDGEDDNSAAEE